MSETLFPIFCTLCIVTPVQLIIKVRGNPCPTHDDAFRNLKDEPFHVPQAQAYCRGEYDVWDPKITTPPGLYLISVFLKRVFLVKCNLAMLRLTPTLTLMVLPLALTRLISYHKRELPPSSILAPLASALVLTAFPISFFFGFLYYTEVPSLLFVVLTVVAASQGNHRLAALLGAVSCTFRQTNIVWVLYAYASSQLMHLRFRRAPPGQPAPAKLHDPPALIAGPGDLVQTMVTSIKVLPSILPAFIPYSLVLAAFGSFVHLNGGIVLGDKSNHVPSFHIPQLYYFIAATTFFGWPVLVSGPEGIIGLLREVKYRMIGNKIRTVITIMIGTLMGLSVYLFTIHHPFLLSDNRHYTFYVWRIYMFHPSIPYLLVPVYLACAWAWFLRIGKDQTLLQSLLVPVFVVPTLLPTPLLEPRYFLIPYVLLRAQVTDVPSWGVALEGAWYAIINAITLGIFLYLPREGVGRFMW